MTTKLANPRLDRLFNHLDALKKRATVEQLREWLTEANVTIDDVKDFIRFDKDKYLRNLVREGEHYHVLVLCWRSGQRSPIHNHRGSVCGLKVLKGVSTETVFEFTPSTLIKAVLSHDMHEGELIVSADTDTHQVSNLQAKGSDLITLHIYSPPLLRMDSYSLTDAMVGEFRPMILAHVDGSGI